MRLALSRAFPFQSAASRLSRHLYNCSSLGISKEPKMNSCAVSRITVCARYLYEYNQRLPVYPEKRLND